MIEIKHTDAIQLLSTIKSGSIDLILTDPPYVISKESGMQQCRDNNVPNQPLAIQTDFGDWDKNFLLSDLQLIIEEFSRVLRKGGTAIIFFDIWKISNLKDMLESSGLVQIRFIEWIKTNPVPINSKANYLSNAREIALTAVKGGSSTFNSAYDNGIYSYAIHQGKNGDRIHPTQKSLGLFEEIILKHSNKDDLVLDCFSGSGTTAIASLRLGRNFIGCELDSVFHSSSVDRLKKYSPYDQPSASIVSF